MAAAHPSVYYLQPLFASLWSQCLDIGYHFLGEISDFSQIFSILKETIQTKAQHEWKIEKLGEYKHSKYFIIYKKKLLLNICLTDNTFWRDVFHLPCQDYQNQDGGGGRGRVGKFVHLSVLFLVLIIDLYRYAFKFNAKARISRWNRQVHLIKEMLLQPTSPKGKCKMLQ